MIDERDPHRDNSKQDSDKFTLGDAITMAVLVVVMVYTAYAMYKYVI
jgi:hypothetical protein